MLTEVCHIVMGTADLEGTRAFYGGPLGLPELSGDLTSFKIGPTTFELRSDPAMSEPPRQPSVDHIALYVDDIDATHTALNGGVGFQTPPHITPLGHRNMQRGLLAFSDPNGFTFQVSQTVDPRDHLEGRRAAKREMATARRDPEHFGGIDHISMYCSDFGTTRAFLTETLGLKEFFYSDSREEGETVAPGFEQAAFAIGGTDIELASDDTWNEVRPGRIQELGFSTGSLDQAQEQLDRKGISAHRDADGGAISLRDPDGLSIRIIAS